MKILKRNNLYAFFICLFFCQCIDRLEQDLGRPPDILIIEGFIDDDFGPHEIEVSLLTNFTSVSEGGGKRRAEAKVRLLDDLGNSIPVERRTFTSEEFFNPSPPSCFSSVDVVEITTNHMTPSTFRGVAGRSYSLEVVLPDGRTYRSAFQELPDGPDVDSVFVNFTTIPSDNDLRPITGLDVFVVWQDDPAVNNFHFWDITGTYKIETPDRTQDGLCCLYDPRVNDASEGTSCWVIENNLPSIVRSFSDNLVQGTQAVQRIGFVEDDGRRFSSPQVPPDLQYHLEVHQYTMSEGAFDYLSTLDVLSEIDGEIFDPPPVSVGGNFTNIDDPNEQVIGFFGVYGKKSRGIFVPRSLFPEIKQHSVCGDCRRFANGQLEVPEVYR